MDQTLLSISFHFNYNVLINNTVKMPFKLHHDNYPLIIILALVLPIITLIPQLPGLYIDNFIIFRNKKGLVRVQA